MADENAGRMRSQGPRGSHYSLGLAAALLLATVPALAQCLSGDCQNGTGKQDLGYATYEGSFRQGQPEGQGTMDYGGGDKYVGTWQRGREHGSGQLYKKGVATAVTYANGVLQAKAGPPLVVGNKAVGKEKVLGCQQGDCVNGYGVLQTPAGNRYEGAFRDGQFDGPGRVAFASGNTIRADFSANQPLRGSYTYATDGGTVFTGTFGPGWQPLTGTYHSRATGGIVEVAQARITRVSNPRLDSIRAAQPRFVLRACSACGGSGMTTSTSYTSEQISPNIVSYSGGFGTMVEQGRFIKQSHVSFANCSACNGRGQALEKEKKP